MCDKELHSRKPVKAATANSPEARAGMYVSEFHFVCPRESEVERDETGRIKTGTWVVSKEHAIAAVKYGSIVALHATKNESSYLQGKITNWKQKARQPRNSDGNLVAIETGIEFEFEPTEVLLAWKGSGTGEKGYAWAPIPNDQ
ncbi:MAG: hypothetical protein JSR61_09265 [Proteobacteria bacterium]|nr:hypothetical protein [Pseudomonadota bacterium]